MNNFFLVHDRFKINLFKTKQFNVEMFKGIQKKKPIKKQENRLFFYLGLKSVLKYLIKKVKCLRTKSV